MKRTQVRGPNRLQGSKKLSRARKGNDWLKATLGRVNPTGCSAGVALGGKWHFLGSRGCQLWVSGSLRKEFRNPRVDSIFIKVGSLFSLLKFQPLPPHRAHSSDVYPLSFPAPLPFSLLREKTKTSHSVIALLFSCQARQILHWLILENLFVF